MKNRLSNGKMLLAGVVIAGFLTDAEAQVRPIQALTDDQEVNYNNPSGVTNTGTGSLTDRQVMVYDLSDYTSVFAWQHTNSGNFKLNSGGFAVDPDVVMATFNDQDYALAAFINEEGFVEWESYLWNGTSFALYAECILGTERNCGNPNVDVNATGQVVITWHQKDIIQETWNISFPGSDIQLGNSEIGLPQSGSFGFTSSDIFAAYGYINGFGPSGGRCFCEGNEGNVISGVANCKGDQVSPQVIRPMNSNHNGYLYEYNTTPDVAISVQDKQTIVSFTYINGHYEIDMNDAEIHSTSEIVYQQEVWNTSSYGPFSAIGSLQGTPRIASRQLSTFPYDIEIVSAPGRCNDWKIQNWGIFQNNPHAISIVNPDYTKRYSGEPVVTYRGGEDGNDGIYTVAWTSETDFCLDEQYGYDIHARNLINGVPHPTGSVHSYVNKGNINSNGLEGDQTIPAISGRLNSDGVNYLFHENYNGINRMLYKYSSASAGSAQLRAIPTTNNTQTKSSNTEIQDFGAYPNPFSQDINFGFTLDKREVGKFISIIDMRGTEIERIDLSNTNEGANEVTWQPKRKLIAGVYIAKLHTSEGVRSIEISSMQN